jgi:hypothetical protein
VFRHSADRSRGDPDDDGVIGYVAVDDGVRPDDGAIAHGDPAEDLRSGPDPDTVADHG